MLKGLYTLPVVIGPVHSRTISVPWGTYRSAAVGASTWVPHDLPALEHTTFTG